jgi:hypothetical protein
LGRVILDSKNSWVNTRIIVTKMSCPISTPTLKKRRASGISFCATPISARAPAKPSP